MKGTKLYSVLFNKCPRCQRGNFFITNNSYNLRKFYKQHDHCPVCHENFMPEIGFYYGAMYVSYGLTIAIGVGLFFFSYFLFDWSATAFLMAFLFIALLLWPWIYRTARLTWINLFVRFDKDKIITRS